MTRFSVFLLASAASALAVPEGFEIQTFAEPFDADYPAAITVAPNGDVYVSSDQNGSLGKEKGMGRIIRCIDTDGDNVADKFVHFVPDVDSPRGGHIVGDTLYLVHPPYLSSFRDTDGDGVADEKKTLLTGLGGGIEHPRGADHTTNGTRMGIDGWLYIAVGDFGTTPAVGTDGKKYQLHGGGIVRVRPDGTEVEPYAVMTRNTCDVAISPTLDMFSRDNTNDGKGWNTRFHHYTHLGDHGYPRLYHNFTDEMVTPLADYGGGSGTGGLWVDEPGFPGEFGDMLYSCDWTTGTVYYHKHKQVGASYEIQQDVFHKVKNATDIDVDGFSRLYISDWEGGRFKYAGKGKKVGKIHIVTVKDGKPAQYQDVNKASTDELVKLLSSASHTQRFEASRELLKRKDGKSAFDKVFALADDPEQSIEVRVAAIFTCKQLTGAASTPHLVKLAKDDAVREYALRAMTDRKGELEGVPVELYVKSLSDPNPRVVQQALVGLERLQAKDAAPAIIAASTKWSEEGKSPRLKHTAMQALSSIGNIDALLAGVSNPETRWLCLKALNELHQDEVVDGLIAMTKNSKDEELFDVLITLARLHFKEAEWDGKAWWGTRPDDRGPYYAPVEWEASPKIRTALEQGYVKLPEKLASNYLTSLAINRISISQLEIPGLDPVMVALGSPSLNGQQIKLLVEAAKDPKKPFDQRLTCYQALMRGVSSKDKRALGRQINILATWSEEDDLPTEGQQAIEDFINDPWRAEQLKALREEAAKGSDAESTLVWKAILTVTISPLAKEKRKGPARELAKSNPKEVGFFNALADLKLPGYEEQIEAGLNWDNDELIAAAKRAKEATSGAAAEGKRVAELKVEDVTKQVMAAEGKGDLAEGKRLYTSQGCIACHAVDPKAVQKGPYLGSAGSKFTRDYLIESILDPNAVVSQGFQTTLITTKDGKSHMGFVTNEADGVIELRNIAGQANAIKSATVKSRQAMPQSMMPPGLAAGLTVDQFNSLIDYLVSLKAEQ